MNATEWDAKKAFAEECFRSAQIREDTCRANAQERIEREHAKVIESLGPRPTERCVTWTSHEGGTWVWSHEGGVYVTTLNGSRMMTPMHFPKDIPHDVALRVLLLAYPEEPVMYLEDAPLYRAPVGIAAGACVVKDRAVVSGLYHVTEYAQRHANDRGGTVYDLVAVPRAAEVAP